jgi:hypothetical protein
LKRCTYILVTLLLASGLWSNSEAHQSDLSAGLKEALSVGTQNAVQLVSQIDGYYGNEIIKIV